jgi:hypothetical protein
VYLATWPDATVTEVPLARFHVEDPVVRAKNRPITVPPSGSLTFAASTGVCVAARSNARLVGSDGVAATAGNADPTNANTLTPTTALKRPRTSPPRVAASAGLIAADSHGHDNRHRKPRLSAFNKFSRLE